MNTNLLSLDQLKTLPCTAPSPVVYFLWKDGELKYVGGTKSFNSRMYMHECAMNAPPWIDSYKQRVQYDRVTALACTHEDLRVLERDYIEKYRPCCNVQSNPEKHPDYGI